MIFASKILDELNKPMGEKFEGLKFNFKEIAKIDDRGEMGELLMSLIKDGDGGITFYEPRVDKWKRINFMENDTFREEAAKNFVENFTRVYFNILEKEDIEDLEEKQILIEQVLVAAYKAINDNTKISYIV